MALLFAVNSAMIVAVELVSLWDATFDELIKKHIFPKGFLLTCLHSIHSMNTFW